MISLRILEPPCAGAVAATAPAQAREYRHHRDRDDTGAAIAAGIVGLALGAALASSSNDRGYSSSYYRGGYAQPRPYGYSSGHGYYDGYAYAPRAYRTCESRQRVYDPYLGRRVVVRERYAC